LATHILDIRGNIPREHLNELFNAKRGSTTTYTELNIVSPLSNSLETPQPIRNASTNIGCNLLEVL